MLRTLDISFLLMLWVHSVCTSTNIPPPSGNLEVYALPIGQGDCTVIQCPGGQLVVNDCGSTGGAGWSTEGIMSYLGMRVNNITAILISHANTDHYNYLPFITNSTNMNIQSVIISGKIADYAIHDWLDDFGSRLHLINGGTSCIGTSECTVPGGTNFCNNLNVNFNILAANVGPTINEKSIVLKVSSGAFNILLPGDIEGNASIKIATSQSVKAQLQSSIYKMAHHGASRLANQPQWLMPIRPQKAFASSAYNRGLCRHPRCETITRIQNLRTIIAAPAPHAFYCGNSDSTPTDYPAFTEHIYETNPSFHIICLLTYTSADEFHQDCMAVPTAGVSDGVDDECNPKETSTTTDLSSNDKIKPLF